MVRPSQHGINRVRLAASRSLGLTLATRKYLRTRGLG
jgi:hypothetical protein